ncbi:WD40 repeat-like protein, partial [Rhizopogon vinicolor AM-OR11-026]
SISYFLDGKQLASGSVDKTVRRWDVETSIVKTFHGHSGEIRCIDMSADVMLLASGSIDSTARIWSLDTGKLVAGPFESAAWGHEGWLRLISYVPCGKQMISVSDDKVVRRWGLQAGREI